MPNPVIAILSQNIFLMRNVFRAAHSIKSKISNSGAYILILLFEKPLSKNEIVKTVERDYSTVYHAIRRLADDGDITISPQDVCSLTQKGLDLYHQILKIIIGK